MNTFCYMRARLARTALTRTGVFLLLLVLLSSGILIKRYAPRSGKNRKATLSKLIVIADKVKVWRQVKGTWPMSVDQLVQAGMDGSFASDGWGNPIHFKQIDAANGSSIVIISFGSDGMAGGVGDASDIECAVK